MLRAFVFLLFVGTSFGQRPMDPLQKWEQDYAFELVKDDAGVNAALGEGDRRICTLELSTPTLDYFQGHALPVARRALIVVYNLKTIKGVTAIANLHDHKIEEFTELEWNHIPLCSDDVKDARAILSISSVIGSWPTQWNNDKKYTLDISLQNSRSPEGGNLQPKRLLFVYLFLQTSKGAEYFPPLVTVDLQTKQVLRQNESR